MSVNTGDIVHQHLKNSEKMLIVMHTALTEIARCEVSQAGSIAMKHIAETSLITVHKVAKGESLEEGNNVNTFV